MRRYKGKERIYFDGEIRKYKNKETPALCLFCVNHAECLLEDDMTDEKWCSFFNPRSLAYYRIQGGVRDLGRVLKTLEIMRLLSMKIGIALGLYMKNENCGSDSLRFLRLKNLLTEQVEILTSIFIKAKEEEEHEADRDK